MPSPVAVCLVLGLTWGNPLAGMVAAGGAFSVGFGAFQWLGQSRVAPMLWATVGMAISVMGGSVVGHAGTPGTVFNAAWAGFGGGMLLALGAGSSWIGLQCGIFAVVATGYPVGWENAVARAMLILAGGSLQTLFMVGVWALRFPAHRAEEADPFSGWFPAVRTLRENLTPRSEFFRFGVRQAITLAVGAELARFLKLPNGYWVPMTALIVMKPDFRQTFQRGVARVVGTLVGAALATLLAHELRPSLPIVGWLIVLFAWLAYSLVNVNYAAFAVFLTAYIVFLLDFGGLSTAVVVTHRTLNTALGGGLALLSYATYVNLLLPRKMSRELPLTEPPSQS